MRYLISFLFIVFFANITLSAQCYDCDSQAFLGVYSNGISYKKAQKLNFNNEDGSYVTGVINHTAAAKAGLQPFDYIFGIDEYRTNSDRSLTGILRKYESGEKVTIHFYRNGKQQTKSVELGKRSDARYNDRNKKEDPFLGVEQSHDRINRDIKGTRVNIVNNSSAADFGLEDGDIITHINSFPILDWQDMGAAIDMMTVGNNMKVAYIRNGQKNTATGKVKSLAETKRNSYSYSNDNDDDDDDDNWNFNFNFNDGDDDDHDGGDRNSGSPFDVEKRDVEGMAIKIEDMTKSESEKLKEKSNVDMSSSSNLSVKGLNLIPNPKKGMFDLTFELPNSGNTSVNMYNEEGRNIYNYDLGTFSGAFEDRIDISQNGVGTYFLQISQDSKTLVKKVLLSRK